MKSKAFHITTIKIEPEQYALSKKHNLKFVDSFRMGIALRLAELGIKNYDNNLNILRRLGRIQSILEEKSQELEKIKKKNGGK